MTPLRKRCLKGNNHWVTSLRAQDTMPSGYMWCVLCNTEEPRPMDRLSFLGQTWFIAGVEFVVSARSGRKNHLREIRSHPDSMLPLYSRQVNYPNATSTGVLLCLGRSIRGIQTSWKSTVSFRDTTYSNYMTPSNLLVAQTTC